MISITQVVDIRLSCTALSGSLSYIYMSCNTLNFKAILNVTCKNKNNSEWSQNITKQNR